MHRAVDEMAARNTFRGYGPEQGYDFLREAIAKNDFQARGAQVAADEIFVSDGSKCDTGNILDIFGPTNKVAVTDPVYPVYVDTNVMAGRTGPADDQGRYAGLVYIPVTAENDFVPELPGEHVDLIYLCYPNNPTGTVATRGAARGMGGLRAPREGDHSFRRGLRGVHHRSGDPALDLRDRRRARRGDRVPQLQQERRLHRHAVRFTVVPKGLSGKNVRRRDGGAASPVEPPAHDQVQRRVVHRAARGRGGLLARRQAASRGPGRLLPGQRAAAARGAHGGGH